MDPEETPLEVLSRVASMVEDFDTVQYMREEPAVALPDTTKGDGSTCKPKELPTKWKKEQRWRDRFAQPAQVRCGKSTTIIKCSFSDEETPESETVMESPLDMTINRYPVSEWCKECDGVSPRPSVITCISPASQLESDSDVTALPVNFTKYPKDPTSRHAEGSYDPVIDEHFRRSLGKDYQDLFCSPTSNPVGTSVDDHFLKALGPTWIRLQENQKLSEVNPNPEASPRTTSHIPSQSSLVLT